RTLSPTYYNMSKAALNHYSKDAAIKYAKKGIRVNIISPGPISTDFFSRHSSREAANAFEDTFREYILMERMGRAEEVTVMIRMLCSDEASFVTGAELVVDGGTVIKPKH
ncbi:oxidoreductaseshort chain dehydrogenase/reductase family, partial [Aphelenchoides avenae]